MRHNAALWGDRKGEVEKKTLTIPNFITIIRVLFIPVNLVYLIEENYKLALICFLVAAFSDFLDGFLARALDQKSSLGGFLDPMGQAFGFCEFGDSTFL